MLKIVECPNNYVEEKLEDTVGIYKIQKDGMFCIFYAKSDLSDLLSNYFQKSKYFDNLKTNKNLIASMYNEYLGTVDISNIKCDTYNANATYNISNSDMDGYGLLQYKNDGIYLITLLTEKDSRLNRIQDFNKIIKSIKILNPARQPKSYGINKMSSNDK